MARKKHNLRAIEAYIRSEDRIYFEIANIPHVDDLNEEGNSPITEAVKNKRIPLIKYLINKKADLTLKGPNGITPLCAAIIAEAANIIVLLSNHVPREELLNGVFFAINRKTNWIIVRKLLDLIGVDVAKKDPSGKTVLHLCLKFYGILLVHYLIRKDYMKKLPAILIDTDDLDSLQFLIEKYPYILFTEVATNNSKAIVNRKLVDYYVSAMDQKGQPVDLFVIAAFKNMALMKGCLKESKSKGVNLKNLNEVNCSGNTLILLAVEDEDLAMVRFLVDLGANVCKANRNGQTPLDLAVLMNNLRIAECLLQHDGSFTADTALITAIRNGNLAMVNLLLKYVKDVNFEDIKTGEPLLNLALTLDDLDVIEALIGKQPNYSFSGSTGVTPLELSVQIEFKAATKLFIENGADPNSVLKTEGEIPLLHKYLNDCDFEMVQFLVEHNADVNQLDMNNNQCPLIKAVRMNNVKMISFLLRNGAEGFCEHFINRSLLAIAATKEYFPVVDFLIQNKGAHVNNRGATEELLKFAQRNSNFAIYLKKHNIDLTSCNNFDFKEVGNEAA